MFFEKLKTYFSLSLSEAAVLPYYWYGWGLFFTFVVLLWILSRLKRDLVPVFRDEEGGVHITSQALEELVKKSCASMHGFETPSTRIFLKSGELRLRVSLDVSLDGNVKEIRTSLRRKIENIMVENLSFSNFGGVDIVIKGFKEEAS